MIAYAFVLLLVGQAYGGDIVTTLVGKPEASTLVQLVTKAGLVEALKTGTHTVFAPTDAAFSRVPAGTLAALAADTAALAKLLTYHVADGSIRSSDIRNEQQLGMLSGEKTRLNVYTHNHLSTINGAQIVNADVKADNGMIHFIDEVIMPPTGSIVDIAAATPELSTLLTAVKAAGIANELQSNPLTVFAPTNAAFAKLSQADLNKLLGDKNRLKETIEYHAIAHTLYKKGLWNNEFPKSSDSHDDRLRVEVHGDRIEVNNGVVQQTDIQATNGVVHTIDKVLIPIRVGIWLRFGRS